MSLAGSERKQPQAKLRAPRGGKRLFLVCLLTMAAGAWVLGRILHRRLASQELLAYESTLAVYNPAWLASQRTVFLQQTVPARTTFSEFLMGQGIDASTASQLIHAARPVYDLSRVRAGNEVKIACSPRGELRALSYQIDSDQVLRVARAGDEFAADIESIPYTITAEGVSGQVRLSLMQAVEDAGEHDQLGIRLADIFGWDVDFSTDTQRGDSFEAVVEKKTLYGKFQDYGKILAAEYRSGNHTWQAVLYHDPEGRPAYYAPSGKSMKKAFLRSPLRFAAHITSRFTYSRFHPILKRYRPHLGIDYGAPVGSAVQAVASGRVIFAGWHGASGKEIHLRHALGYETYYLHLSQILVKPGQAVQQGELIGRTGSTGLATGPHLDFRITQHGKFRNFLALNLPPAESVSPRDMDDFAATRSRLLDELASLRPDSAAGTQHAALNGPGAGQGK